ncbi:MAG: hypothetical protein IT267_03465 [Saprospiraceae bacterium]|nr:hypothetical protein [Saprospiraceae bacterium]
MKNLLKFCFNTIIIACFFVPTFLMAQTKNVVATHRVFPKVDKVMEFEKALAAHAQKFHKGDEFWRVYMIQSGPDFGGYHITEGPKSWDSEDVRGDISPEHQMDWHKNIAIHLTERQSAGYYVYNDSLSTISLGDFSDKINITHWYPKLGQGDHVTSILKKLKKTWEAVALNVAVYSASSSGPSQIVLVTRYKQGLKERNIGFRKPFKEAHDSANGEGAYEQFLEDVNDYLSQSWSELLFQRKDLGSK